MPSHTFADEALRRISRRSALGGFLATGALAAPGPTDPPARRGARIDAAAHGVLADGSTDDAAALQRAVAALTDDSVLALPTGVIALGSPGWRGITLQRLRNVRIEGNGAVFKWLAAPRQALGPFGPAAFILQDCRGASVRDLVLDGNGIACIGLGLDTCTGCTISLVEAYAHGGRLGGLGQLVSCRGVGNSWVSCVARDSTPGSQFRGFYLGNANPGWGETDLRIEGCSARNNDATGFAIGAVRLTCTGSTSVGNAGAGFISGTAPGSPSVDHVFVGNLAQRNGFHGWQTDVYGPPAERVVLSGNNFSFNAFCGTLCHQGRHVSISDNVLAGNGEPTGAGAIEISGSNDIIVANNLVQGDATHGICVKTAFSGNTLRRIVIANNRFTGSGSNTVWLDALDAGSILQGLLFSGNIVDGGRCGLSLAAAQGARIEDLIIADNLVDGAAEAAYQFSAAAVGQFATLRLTGNAGGRAQFGPNATPGLELNNSWNPAHGRAAAPPRRGAWRRGSIFYNTEPAPGAPVGWICTADGTPGNWSSFGQIGGSQT
jgi:hypothetical protein